MVWIWRLIPDMKVVSWLPWSRPEIIDNVRVGKIRIRTHNIIEPGAIGVQTLLVWAKFGVVIIWWTWRNRIIGIVLLPVFKQRRCIPKNGLVGTQISGLRWCFCHSLQCSNSGNISPMWILDGSAHWNPSGTHSGSIHEDGSSQIFPHGISTFFLPDTYSNMHLLGLCGNDRRRTYGYEPWHILEA